MPKSENQKKKLLYLRDYLLRETDAEHTVSASELVDYLAAHDIPAERKSIYSDIRVLQEYGVPIELTPGRGGGYYVSEKTFELPELKLLVDAVQSSRFLTERKSRELIKKLETLAGRDAGQLRRQLTVSGRVKTMNESIYYNVDRIHDAISQDRQIRFRYFNWGVDGKRRFREKTYQASPCALIWNNENYYLLARSDRPGITHYRVDKMDSIRITELPREHSEETDRLDLAAYSKKVFGMFGGREITVRLRFQNELAGVVIDRFGHDIILVPDGDSHFTCTVPITDSPMFFGWLTSFGNGAKILFPPELAEEYAQTLRRTLAQYDAPTA